MAHVSVLQEVIQKEMAEMQTKYSAMQGAVLGELQGNAGPEQVQEAPTQRGCGAGLQDIHCTAASVQWGWPQVVM